MQRKPKRVVTAVFPSWKHQAGYQVQQLIPSLHKKVNLTVFRTLTSQSKSTIVYYNFYHSFHSYSASESPPTFESPAPSIARSSENKTFYNSEINSVTSTPNSQTRT